VKEIAVSDEQYEYVEALRERLQAEHAGRYGHVRPRDAVQYLIDTHAPVGDGSEPPRERPVDGDGVDGAGDPEDGDEEDPANDGGNTGGSDASGAETGGGADAEDGDDRLSAMMSLLETHEEKWDETPSENGRYEVQLPDGDLEVVQTKDEVRAVLFKNY